MDYFDPMSLIKARPTPKTYHYPPLLSQMGVSLLLNEHNKVWIVHDRKLPNILSWVEYDKDFKIINLVYQDGEIQELGIRVQPDMWEGMFNARQVYVMLLQGNQYVDTYILPFLERGTRKTN